MWQALNPNATLWKTPANQTSAIFGTPAGAPLTPAGPLKPFADAAGKPVTSTSVRPLAGLGYSYPELTGDHNASADGLRRQVTTAVNELYVGDAGATDTRRAKKWAVAGRRHTFTGKTVGREEGRVRDLSVRLVVDRADQALCLPAVVDVIVYGMLAGRLAMLEMPAVGIARATVPLRRALARTGVAVDGAGAASQLEGGLKIVVRNVSSTTACFSVPDLLSIKSLSVTSSATAPPSPPIKWHLCESRSKTVTFRLALESTGFLSTAARGHGTLTSAETGGLYEGAGSDVDEVRCRL
jgi:hypothetical protein